MVGMENMQAPSLPVDSFVLGDNCDDTHKNYFQRPEAAVMFTNTELIEQESGSINQPGECDG